MPQSLARLHIHLVFSTKNRERIITDEVRSPLHAYMERRTHPPWKRGARGERGGAVEALQRVGFCGVDGRVGADINSLAGHIIS